MSTRAEWLVLLLALLIVAGTGGYDLYRSRERLAATEGDRLLHNVGVVAENIDRQMHAIGSGLDLLRKSSGSLESSVVTPQWLNELAATMGGVSSISIADAETVIVASNSPELVGRSFRGSERDLAIRAGHDPRTLYVFPPYRSPLGRYTIGAAKVLLDEHGQFGGFIFVALDPSYFETVLKSAWYGPDDLRLGLVHGDGRLVYRVPVENGLAGVDLSADPQSLFTRHIRSGQQTSLLADISAEAGESRLAAFRTVDLSDAHADKPLVVYASRGIDAIFARWQMELVIKVMAFALLAAVSALGLAAAQRRRRDLSRLEEKQARASELLRLATEGAQVGIWYWTMPGETLEWSDRCRAMFELPPGEEPSFEHFYSILHPDDRERVEQQIREAVEHRVDYASEYRVVRPDGSVRWVSAPGRVYVNADGSLRGMGGIVMDITVQKKVELELERARQLMADGERIAGMGVWEYIVATQEMIWSEGERRIYGIESTQKPPHYGRMLRDCIHPDDAAELDRTFRSALESGKAFAMEHRIVRPDGAIRRVRDLAHPRFDDQGQLARYVGTTVDVTDLRDAEQQVRESEKRHRALVNAASNIVYEMSADWTVMYLLVGRQFLRDTTSPSESWVETYIPAEDRAQVKSVIAEAIRSKGLFQLEHRVLHADGGIGWVYSRATPILDDDGNIVEWFGMATDISATKEHERELQQAQEAALAASRAKSEFLAHMSHEIRTPMNAVINITQLLQDEPLTREQSELVNTISEAGRSLLRIINDILDFSKIEAGQLQLEQRPFELAALLSRVESLLHSAAETKGLRLTIGSPPRLARAVSGDVLRLEQVLVNLVNNAIKFTRQGGVTLEVAVQDDTPDGVRLRFEVRDTGIGIAPDALKTLFQPFSQADRGITRRFGGTGLGLVIARQIVEMMGGQIGVTSTPGAGSTFWFEVPFTWAEVETGPSASDNAVEDTGPQLSGLRVLAADDNQVNLLIVDRILKSQGATTVFAADGQQALQILQANPKGFDVVLMDVQMPVMDGLTATRMIRADPSLAAIPVIALTAGVLGAERDRALAIGVNDILPKPLDPKRMIAMLAPMRLDAKPGGRERSVDVRD